MIALKNKALPPLQSIKFGARDDTNHLVQVIQGGDAGEGLAMAADLALGVEHLCARLDVAINDGEDPVTCVELRALGLLASTAAALVQSVRYSLRDDAEASQ
ncbi:hypothetical protein KDX38_27210 [Pseudomonas sp. CDFA 602]|uniref:hypothetical protein n=1 Tax=Pseudomonas californiensis TaxID=2829823 RepID=UPI001E49096C|nr:hypothetical protein [Pseudomonas californiensis]MCD5997262.1 hypothetical protein [Pseudomonas californiensis]MCD6002858.1 hypothetical protein [Pseudomonas californiensis]